MKTELLATLTAALAIVNDLPNDPLPEIPTPTGLMVISTYGGEGNATLSIELGWFTIPPGLTPSLDVKGAEGNPAGPQEWTGIPVNGSPGVNGEWATHHLANPNGQAIVFRLRWSRIEDNGFSEPALLPFPVIG